MTGGWPAHPLPARIRALVLPALVLAGLVALVYGRAVPAEFVYDSRAAIPLDPRIRSLSLESLRQIVSQDYWRADPPSGLYRPLTTLTWLLNWTLLGNRDRPAGYLALNAALHWLNALLVYLLGLALHGRRGPALAAAVLFAAHPVATEAVTNLVGRADLLAAASVLAGTLLYGASTRASRERRRLLLAALALTTALGVFAKESALVVAGALLAWDLVHRLECPPAGRLRAAAVQAWRWLKEGYAVLLPPFLLFLLARFLVFRPLRPPEIGFIDNPLVEAGGLRARLTALRVLGEGVALLVWPARLSADYSHAQEPVAAWPPGPRDAASYALAALALGALLAALARVRRDPATAFFGLFALAAILPASNLLVLIGSIRADRFLYLPSVGLAGALTLASRALVDRLPAPGRMRRTLPVLAVVLLASLLAWRSVARNRDWRDERTLWERTVETSPRSARAHGSLALAIQLSDPEGREVGRVIEQGEASLAITPRYVPALVTLAGAYLRRGEGGDVERASQVLEVARREDEARARRLESADRERGEGHPDPRNPEIPLLRGLALARQGAWEPALEELRLAQRLAPGNPEVAAELGRQSRAAGRLDAAVRAQLRAYVLAPRRPGALLVLALYLRERDPAGCEVRVDGGGSPGLDPGCPALQRELCAAAGELTQDLAARKDRATARRIQGAIAGLPCP